MLKKKVIPIARNTIGVKCGDCLHFKNNAKFEKPCYDLGIKKFSDAPACFSPNVYFLGRQNPDLLFQLGMILKDFTAQDSRVFLALLKQQKSFEKNYNLKFGQPVYFCLGADYLSNYFLGYVIGVAEAGDGQVFVGSSLGGKQRSKPMVGSFLRDGVFTVSEFKKRQAQLVKAGRLNDPKPLYTAPTPNVVSDVSDYTPPSMDTAPSEWFDKNKPLTKKDARLKSKAVKRRLDGKLEFVVSRTGS